MRELRQSPGSVRAEGSEVQDPRDDAHPEGDEALLLPAQRVRKAAHQMGRERQRTLAAPRAHLHAELAPGGFEGPADHPRPGLGHRGPRSRLRDEADQLRYYGVATMPETKDTDFEWEGFAQRNNSELLAVYGNFVHRALTFADKNFDHAVPAADFLDAADKKMIRAIEQQWNKVGQNLEYVHLKDAMKEAIQLARLGNQYFDQKAPWELIKKDRAACGTVLHVALRVGRSLAIIMAPFLPFSSSRLWRALGYDTDVHSQTWEEALEDVPAGQALRVGKPLFTKIDLSEAKETSADRLDLRVAQIADVQELPNADNLYVLQVDIGGERRQIVAGIRKNYPKDQLRGRKIVVLLNLEPATLRAIESRALLLAGGDKTISGLPRPPPAPPAR